MVLERPWRRYINSATQKDVTGWRIVAERIQILLHTFASILLMAGERTGSFSQFLSRPAQIRETLIPNHHRVVVEAAAQLAAEHRYALRLDVKRLTVSSEAARVAASSVRALEEPPFAAGVYLDQVASICKISPPTFCRAHETAHCCFT